MRVKVTQYGYPNDPDSDSLTEAQMGAWNNKLKKDSCALTKATVEELGAQKFDTILLTFDDGSTITRSYDDKAPESDPRVDLYMPERFDSSIADYADASIVKDS
jgi:hypothetical protein